MKQLFAITTTLMGLALAAAAQDSDALVKTMKIDAERMAAQAKIVSVRGAVMGNPVKGAPYSAIETTENNQVLSDGTRIHNETMTTVYRDSEGRVRRETPDEITIWDPVAGKSYVLNPKTQTARQLPFGGAGFFYVNASSEGKNVMFNVKLPPPDSIGVAVGGEAGAQAKAVKDQKETMRMVETKTKVLTGAGAIGQTITYSPKAATESLGTQTMEGVNADGTRITSTIETGAIGNDRPIQIVSERWYSQDLQTLIKSRQSDPRMGEETYALTNINRAEPAPYLFQVPAGYQVVEQK